MLARPTARRGTGATIRRTMLLAAIVAAGTFCSDDATSPDGEEVVAGDIKIDRGTDAGPVAVAVFPVSNADSARVLYIDSLGASRATPFVPVSNGQARVVVIGLEPDSRYQLYGQAIGGDQAAYTEPASFTSDSLPSGIEDASIDMTSGTFSGGYILTEVLGSDSTLYAAAFDSTGRLVWYRRFAGHHQIGDLQQQPNGNFTIYLGGSTGWQPVPGEYDEFTSDGRITHRWSAPAPYYTDGHELRLVVSDTTVVAAYLFGYDQHSLDMTEHGGGPDALTAVHKIFRLSPSGDATLLFDAIDRWTPNDWVSPPLDGAGDMDHPNSLDFDEDGNIIVSWRSLGAITKHDAESGAVIWQLGGTRGDVTLTGDPLDGFGGQHYARALPDGDILLYDNGTNHSPPETRPVQYAIDDANKTATFVWDYRRPSPISTTFMGSTQRLPNGNTLIGYSTSAVLTEVTSSGSVVAEGQLKVRGAPSQFYRAMRIESFGL